VTRQRFVSAQADSAGMPDEITHLVVCALLTDGGRALLAEAADQASTTRDRQLVAIATAHLDGDDDRLDALVRDHLADHPDNVLAAWIAAIHTRKEPS
jgi:hypothetical protein